MTNLLPRTANITRLFRQATPAQIERGLDWYQDANLRALDFAMEFDVTLDQAAGILAAFSPINSWEVNQLQARRFFESEGTYQGYLPAMLKKARAILAGEPVLDHLTSDKVRNFYLGIVSAGEAGITIDRHAYDIAVNVRHSNDGRPTLTPKRYAEFAATYARAAVILSREAGYVISPARVQAVTWGVWRNKFWADGAFDPEARKVA